METILQEVFILLLMILISPVIARFLRVPVVVAEIIIGIVIGPSFLNLLHESAWLLFMSMIGFIYLMFIVGLEVELSYVKESLFKVVAISLGSFLTPFALGYLIGVYFNVSPSFIGLALSTTSMGVILPTVKEFSSKKEVAQVILGAAILVDIISMFALMYIVEQTYLTLDKVFLIMILLLALIAAAELVKACKSLRTRIVKSLESHHLDVKLSLTTIFGLSVFAEYVGIHAIIGSFFAGLLISELEDKVEGLLEKLLSFGYGFFIPTFFITVGIRTNLKYLISGVGELELLIALLAAGFMGKILGTSIPAKILGFNKYESLSMGFAMNARLSLIIAAAELGVATGIIGPETYSTFILLAVVSVIASPFLAKICIGKSPIVIPKEIPIP